jgi:hypothetical protein
VQIYNFQSIIRSHPTIPKHTQHSRNNYISNYSNAIKHRNIPITFHIPTVTLHTIHLTTTLCDVFTLYIYCHSTSTNYSHSVTANIAHRISCQRSYIQCSISISVGIVLLNIRTRLTLLMKPKQNNTKCSIKPIPILQPIKVPNL